MPARRSLAAGLFAGRAWLFSRRRLRAALRRRPRPEAPRGLAGSEADKRVPGGRLRGDEAAESAGGHRCATAAGEKRGGRRVPGTEGSGSPPPSALPAARGRAEPPRPAARIGLPPGIARLSEEPPRGLGAVIRSEDPGCAAGDPAVTSERAERARGRSALSSHPRLDARRVRSRHLKRINRRRSRLRGLAGVAVVDQPLGPGAKGFCPGEVAAKEDSPASSTGDGSAGRAAQELRQQLTRKQWRNRQKNKRRQKNKFKASDGRLLASSAADDPLDEQGGPTPDSEVPGRQTSSLRQRLESRLEAARFRYINQLLYTRSSQEAAQLFQEDPEALGVYHRGFALQAAHWPERPVERFVHYLHRRPASLVVADFGCGDCTLARSLPNRVHCFDLAALDPRVTVCDMAQVPLEDASVDVAVFCLALMGTNLREILQEAHRVLRAGGTLLVAEVASRFADLRAFLGALARLGFRLTSKDVSGSHFYTFELRKTDRAETAKAAELRGLALRPCLYKRR
uniref:Ribosomal RNA-processing protein 8 n=1 Tax=Pseudonaja textilis TaxID=8673 RepID=A0A670YYB0_PSETE